MWRVDFPHACVSSSTTWPFCPGMCEVSAAALERIQTMLHKLIVRWFEDVGQVWPMHCAPFGPGGAVSVGPRLPTADEAVCMFGFPPGWTTRIEFPDQFQWQNVHWWDLLAKQWGVVQCFRFLVCVLVSMIGSDYVLYIDFCVFFILLQPRPNQFGIPPTQLCCCVLC